MTSGLEGAPRSQQYLRQVGWSTVFRIAAIFVSLASVPLLIEHLGPERFGVWSTILSVLTWVIFFDFGVGNSLRNNVATAVAKAEFGAARDHITSSVVAIGRLALLMFVACAAATPFVSLQSVFNTGLISENVLRTSLLVLLFFSLFNFCSGLVNQLLHATQRSALVIFGQFASSATAYLLCLALIHTGNLGLLTLSCSYGVALVAASIGLNIWFFKRHPNLRPALRLATARNKLSSEARKTGIQFFVIQIAVILIFTTDRILISQLLGPATVAEYDVVFKIFSVVLLAHGLITAPLWSAYSDALARSDFSWIKRTVVNQTKVYAAFLLLTLAICSVVDPIVQLWIGSNIHVSPGTAIAVAVMTLISTWSAIFSALMNGLGRLQNQLRCSIVAMSLNIPLAIYFVKVHGLGINGIVYATCISLSLFSVLGPIECWKFLRAR